MITVLPLADGLTLCTKLWSIQCRHSIDVVNTISREIRCIYVTEACTDGNRWYSTRDLEAPILNDLRATNGGNACTRVTTFGTRNVLHLVTCQAEDMQEESDPQWSVTRCLCGGYSQIWYCCCRISIIMMTKLPCLVHQLYNDSHTLKFRMLQLILRHSMGSVCHEFTLKFSEIAERFKLHCTTFLMEFEIRVGLQDSTMYICSGGLQFCEKQESILKINQMKRQ